MCFAVATVLGLFANGSPELQASPREYLHSWVQFAAGAIGDRRVEPISIMDIVFAPEDVDDGSRDPRRHDLRDVGAFDAIQDTSINLGEYRFDLVITFRSMVPQPSQLEQPCFTSSFDGVSA